MENLLNIIDSIISVAMYLVLGFVGFIVLLFLLALVFGKRVVKKWEFEANFYDDNRREIGEFDIEMKKYAKEEGDFKLEAKFVLKHPELQKDRVVQVYLDDTLVMEGVVEKEGRIRLNNEHLKSDITDSQEGQVCRVLCSSVELFSEKIVRE